MTLNLFDVDDALDSEDTAMQRLQRALDWKFRKREREKKELEEASSAQESGLPEEAPKSSSPT